MDRDSFPQVPRSRAHLGGIFKVLSFAACASSLWAVPAHAQLDGTVLRDELYAAATDGATITWAPGIYVIGADPAAPPRRSIAGRCQWPHSR